jgi:hypothetical protein
MFATSFTWATHASSAAGVTSMHARFRARRSSMHCAIQFTCCSIDGTMFDSTDGEPGPVIRNRLGKPAVPSPR